MIWGDVSVVDVFEQVEEELRSDRYKRLARTWLPIVGGVLAIALIAALGWWGWQSYQTGRADKASLAYEQGVEAVQTGNTVGANAFFATAAKEGNGAYKSLALQQQAGMAVTANRIPDAIKLFDEAAKASNDPILADPARLKAAFLIMDTAPLADIEARLTPLTEEGRPLRPFAQEALALARLQHGKTAEARGLFVQLTLGQDVPDSIRQRAQLGIDAVDTGAAANIADIVKAQAALPPAPVAQAGAAAVPAPAQTPVAPAQ